MANNIKITGLKTLQVQLKALPKIAKEELFKEYQKFALATEAEAKENAPTDEGLLKNSIKGEAFYEGDLVVAEISVNVKYAAYLEFGTRKFAAKYVNTLPADWQSFAAQSKGKGDGDFYDFLNNILDWVIRKGIANRYSIKTQKKIDIKIGGTGKKSLDDQDRLESAAYIIARSILINGIKPQPYLYPAVQNETGLLLRRLKKLKLA